MQILVFNTHNEIKAWLVGETIESAPQHIANGYPDLAADYATGIVIAQEIDVLDAHACCPDLFMAVDGQIVLKEA